MFSMKKEVTNDSWQLSLNAAIALVSYWYTDTKNFFQYQRYV